MSDPTPPTGETAQPTAQEQIAAEPKADETHPAVIRINAEKAALKAENERLAAELKAAKLEQLPEEDQIEEGFREMYSMNIISQIPAEGFSKLPTVIQDQLRKNPWAFTSQDDVDQAGMYAANAKDYYSKIAPIAVANINRLIEEGNGSAGKTEQIQVKDPSLSSGGGGQEPAAGYSEGELRAMALTDPEKFLRIHRAARGK
jgi:hypothetical protein